MRCISCLGFLASIALVSCRGPATEDWCAASGRGMGSVPTPGSSTDVYRWRAQVTPVLDTRAPHPPRTQAESLAFAQVRRRVDALWAKDSASIEWVLAWLAVDEDVSDLSVATNAAIEYRRLSGRPLPMLALMKDYAQDDGRRALGLQAITSGTLREDEQDFVFRLACDAAQHLSPFVTDSKLKVWRSQQPRRWYESATRLLLASRVFLEGQRQTAVDRMLTRLKLAP